MLNELCARLRASKDSAAFALFALAATLNSLWLNIDEGAALQPGNVETLRAGLRGLGAKMPQIDTLPGLTESKAANTTVCAGAGWVHLATQPIVAGIIYVVDRVITLGEGISKYCSHGISHGHFPNVCLFGRGTLLFLWSWCHRTCPEHFGWWLWDGDWHGNDHWQSH